jgi:choice-of-anchor A domain-containing protein
VSLLFLGLAATIGLSGPSGTAAGESAAASAIQCMDDPLGPAPDWNVLVHGDMVQSNTDSEGRVAVGGNATLTQMGIGTRLSPDGSRVDLAVGGDLDATRVQATGSIVYGGSLSGNPSSASGTVSQRSLNLDALFQEEQRRADAWHGLEPNGEISGPKFGALYLTGENPQLNVFRIEAARLESAQRILLRVPFGSSALVNVLGDIYSTAGDPQTVSLELWDGEKYVQFGDSAPSPELELLRRSLLWNFAAASFVQIGPQLAWQGSVLAPGAAFSFPGNTQLNGTIIVGSLRGGGESHLHPPDGICLPDPGTDPPEPPEPPPTPPGPGPSPELSPEPSPEPGVPSFSEPSEESGALPGDTGQTEYEVRKEVFDRQGRPVELLETRPGRLVKFRLFKYNLGFAGARGVVACDRVPPGLEVVRVLGNPRVRGDRICWHLGTVNTQREAIVTFRVHQGVCGRVTNGFEVTTGNAGRERDTAQLSACRRVLPSQTG